MSMDFIWSNSSYFISALLFGLFVALVQLVAKRPLNAVIPAMLKAIIGFLVFCVGISVFLYVANNMRLLATASFNVVAPANTNTLIQTQAIYYIPVMGLGFLLHLLVEKYLVPKKYQIVYMGGCHILLRMSLLTTGVATVVYGQTNWFVVVLFGSVLSALWYCIQPLYVDKFARRIRGDGGTAYGHQTSIALTATAFLVKLFIRKRKDGDDTESVKIPKALGFMRDMGVCMALLQILVMLIFGLMCGTDVVKSISGNVTAPWLWLLFQGVLFSGGYFILTNGLRMITGEAMPGLTQISDKILPNVRMAMDIPTFFPYGQNAVLYGAASGSIVFIALMFLFSKLGWGFIGGATLYFYMVAGGSAIYGNKVGGKCGAIIGGVVTAIMMASGSLLIQYLGGSFYEMEYFSNVASEPDDRLILYPIIILLGRLFFGERKIPFGL